MTVKQKTVWYCSDCGNKTYKWVGQCTSCLNWNTMQEETIVPIASSRFNLSGLEISEPTPIHEITFVESERFITNLSECDRLFGGGIVPGSLVLIGGDPGIGKSTLMLQIAGALEQSDHTILYVSGEESCEQTSMRAKRLGICGKKLYLFSETNLSLIKQQVDKLKPDVLIIDSIQVVYKDELTSCPGSVSQVREAATDLMHLSKRKKIATFIIGHVTKTGEIAGPRVLEHLVDTVLYFEGDRHQNFRMVRVVKNRFGATDEVAVFQMRSDGLKEVKNPSRMFVEENKRPTSGSCIASTLEGTRAILIEVQALVSKTVYPAPARRSSGLDQNRLALLLAVMEKRLRIPLYQSDVFASVVGGLKILEPGIDLGVIFAIASSFQGKIVDPKKVVMGEVGLTGEVRAVARIESRVKEAIQLGFTKCIIPKANLEGITDKARQKIQIISVETVEDAIKQL